MDRMTKILNYLNDIDLDDGTILEHVLQWFPRSKCIECLEDLLIDLDLEFEEEEF